MKKVAIFSVLALLAVTGGVGWAVWETSSRSGLGASVILQKLPQATLQYLGLAGAIEAPEAAAGPGREGSTTPEKTGSGELAEAPAAVSPEQARQNLEQAEQLFQAGDTTRAGAILRSLLAQSADEPTKQKAQKLLDRLKKMELLHAEIASEDRQPLDTIHEFTLISGRTLRGLIIEETLTGVRVQKSRGIEVTVARGLIRDQKPVPKERILQEAQAEYRRRFSQFSNPDGLDYYGLALFCHRNGLDDLVRDNLSKAAEKDQELLGKVQEARAKLLYDMVVWYRDHDRSEDAEKKRKEILARYPDSTFAGLLQADEGGGAPVAAAQPPAAAEPASKPARVPQFENPEVARWVQEANRWFEEGLVHLRNTYQHEGMQDEENWKALDAFKKACALYEQAQEKVDHPWLRARLHEAGKYRVACFLQAKPR